MIYGEDRMRMKRLMVAALAVGTVFSAGMASSQEYKVAVLYAKTHPFFEPYAKQTEIGFNMGMEYLTNNTMMIDGHKIKVIFKDTQGKPDLAKALLTEAYIDEKVDLAVGPSSSGEAIAVLPVAEENKKILIVEPAVADEITGSKWNKYIFRTGRNSSQDAGAAAALTTTMGEVSIGILAQDNVFGREAVRAFKDALALTKSKTTVVHEEYAAPATSDFTAPAQRIFDGLKDKPGIRVLNIVWAGPNPVDKIATLKPERFNIILNPGGNLLPLMKGWAGKYAGAESSIYYYYGFPKNKMNDWFVSESMKRYKMPPDFFSAGGFSAASAVVTALRKAKSIDAAKMIAAMEGMEFDTPKGTMTFRKEDHQAMQPMYHFRFKAPKDQKNEWDLLELVREIQAKDIYVPITNKR
jgi:branched-chain amino acid transport system substrate-binding protein